MLLINLNIVILYLVLILTFFFFLMYKFKKATFKFDKGPQNKKKIDIIEILKF